MATDLRLTRLDPGYPATLTAPGRVPLSARAVAIGPDALVLVPVGEQALDGLGPECEVRLEGETAGAGLTARASALGALPANGAPASAGARLFAFTGLDQAARERIDGYITRNRKADHIRICRDDDVAADGVTTGFERYRLPHEALPELHKRDVDLGAEALGRKLAAPFLISCMTGGSELAKVVNGRLAEAAARLGFALGVGSQRALLKAPDLLDTYEVRAHAPDALVLGNLGAVQLNYGVTRADCDRLVAMVGADALVLHLNPLQEAVQPEGDVDFRGLKAKIAALAAEAPYPVLLKEVGNGIGPGLARWVGSTRIAGVDVAGAGGTSWSKVESFRARDPVQQRVARRFGGWGWPTAEALVAARRALPDRLVIASGGMKDGLTAAKAIALGADLVGVARPFLEAATRSLEAVLELGRQLVEELRVAMFCAGAGDLGALRAVEVTEVGGGSGAWVGVMDRHG